MCTAAVPTTVTDQLRSARGARSTRIVNEGAKTMTSDAVKRDTTPVLLQRPLMPEPTIVFDTFWNFAARRQDIYFRRLANTPEPWSTDPILARYRFTNAYRALDRVSQYLIGSVAYRGSEEIEEVFFRVLLFKIFNRIETWEMLCSEVGWPTWSEYRFETYDRLLTLALERGKRIYSAAYIMPSAKQWGEDRKHGNHLRLLEAMMNAHTPERVAEASTMADAFSLLRGFHSIGDFLAYQLVTDLNYTAVCNFDEMDFVAPGPGARDGLTKCFASLGDLTFEDAIRWVADTQHEQFERRGLEFSDLWGRPLQLIDCQNLFCEVDKYARVAHPEIDGVSGRSRIKQQFRSSGPLRPPVLPPKWRVEVDLDRLAPRCTTH
jgi:5-hmdU DNA kinase, helical domain